MSVFTDIIDAITGTSSASSSAASTVVSVTGGITSDIGAIANLIGAFVNEANLIRAALQTPAMVDAQTRANMQKRLDAINAALASGDLNALRLLSSS